jgi:hypothetical protein
MGRDDVHRRLVLEVEVSVTTTAQYMKNLFLGCSGMVTAHLFILPLPVSKTSISGLMFTPGNT